MGQKIAAAVPLAVATPALAITTSEAASRSFSDGGKKLGAPGFTGTFSDPMHLDLPRTISYAGGRDFQIDGADEDGKPWKVLSTRKDSSTLLVDFTAKGGPA